MECGQCSAVYQFISGYLVNVLFGVVEDRHKKVVHFRKLVFALQRLIHRKDKGHNINYHIPHQDIESFDAFDKYLFYNGAIHVRNILAMLGDQEVQIETENTVYILRKIKEKTLMIIRNAIRCNICGVEIESKHRHDYVE